MTPTEIFHYFVALYRNVNHTSQRMTPRGLYRLYNSLATVTVLHFEPVYLIVDKPIYCCRMSIVVGTTRYRMVSVTNGPIFKNFYWVGDPMPDRALVEWKLTHADQ